MTTLANIRLAASPTTWGVDFADNPRNPAWNRVLDEIEASGVDTLELGPVGYLPEDPQILGPELESRGLSTAGTFMFQPIFDDAREDEVLDVARRTSGLVRELNGDFLILVDQPTAGAVDDPHARLGLAQRLGVERAVRPAGHVRRAERTLEALVLAVRAQQSPRPPRAPRGRCGSAATGGSPARIVGTAPPRTSARRWWPSTWPRSGSSGVSRPVPCRPTSSAHRMTASCWSV